MIDLMPGSYLSVFLLLAGAGVGLPIPEEIPVISGGVLVGRPGSELSAGLMLAVCMAGVVLSDGVLYALGRWGGPWLRRFSWVRARLGSATQQALEDRFRRHGLKVLLCARLLPGLRGPIFIAAGLARMPLAWFLIADGLYAIPGVTLLFTLGCTFSGPISELVHWAMQIKLFLGVVLLVAVLVMWRWRRSQPPASDSGSSCDRPVEFNEPSTHALSSAPVQWFTRT